MDLLFWENIVRSGENTDTIKENTILSQFQTIYDGYSLFHYFAKNVDVIEMIHDKYLDYKENGMITHEEENMPLAMLQPDENGNTALDTAIKQERPKSFELMIDLLEPFNSFCLSKMLL